MALPSQNLGFCLVPFWFLILCSLAGTLLLSGCGNGDNGGGRDYGSGGFAVGPVLEQSSSAAAAAAAAASGALSEPDGTIAQATTAAVGGVASLTLVGPGDLVLTRFRPVSFMAVASGGSPAFSFSAQGLPDGLSIDTTSGQVSGTPLVVGSFTAALTVVDSAGTSISRTVGILVVSGAVLTVPPRLNLKPGVPTRTLLAFADGGLAPYSMTATGVPEGLFLVFLSEGAAFLDGSPKFPGLASISITLKDSIRASDTRVCQLNVSDDGFWVEVGMATSKLGRTFDQQVCLAKGGHPWKNSTWGTPIYDYQVSGLPSGTTMLPSTPDHVRGTTQLGTLSSGTLTSTGRFLLTATATDASGTIATGYGYVIVNPN